MKSYTVMCESHLHENTGYVSKGSVDVVLWKDAIYEIDKLKEVIREQQEKITWLWEWDNSRPGARTGEDLEVLEKLRDRVRLLEALIAKITHVCGLSK